MGHDPVSPQTFTIPVIIEVWFFPPFLTQVTVLDAEFWGGGGERQVSMVGVAWSAFDFFLGKDINVLNLG